MPGQEQVQLPQVQARGALHEPVRTGADHLRHHPGRCVHVPGLLEGTPPVRLQGRTQELRRGVLHRSPRGSPPASSAGKKEFLFSGVTRGAYAAVVRLLLETVVTSSTHFDLSVAVDMCSCRQQCGERTALLPCTPYTAI